MQIQNSILAKFPRILKGILMLVFITLLNSCDVVKRVKSNEHLITKNTIIVDDKINKEERVNNIITQKTNSGMNSLLGFPLKLHVYNLARPNIDSILQAKVLSDSSKVSWKTKLLSKKQFDKEIEARKKFNSWLKRTGEKPTIYDEDKTLKTVNNLRKYYYSKGWFDNEVTFEVDKDSNKRAQVTYKITKKQPYFLDSLRPVISSPSIDSLYPKFIRFLINFKEILSL